MQSPHIVFDDKQVAEPEDRKKMLNAVNKTAKISGVNQKRFEQYGVLSGIIDESNLDKVRKIPVVAGVEVDEDKYLQ